MTARAPLLFFHLAAAIVLASSPASADLGFALHAEGAAAHLVGERSDQFGWGAAGLVAPELRIWPKLGVELPVGVVGVAGAAAAGPMYAATSTGAAFFALPGVRLRPLAGPVPEGGDVFWIAGGIGVADSAGLACPAVDARFGLDLHLGPVTTGPFVGYLQIVNTHGGVRPSDARVLFAGLHFPIARHPRLPRPAPPPAALAAAPAVLADADRPASMSERCPGDPDTPGAYEVDRQCPEERPPIAPPADPRWITLDDRVPFDVGSAVMTRAARSLIARFAEALRAHPEWDRVRVVGHADESGTRAFNLRLSEARARRVEAALLALGVPPGRLSVAFWGNQRPLRSGRSLAAQRANRRVEMEILRQPAGGGTP